MEAPRASGPGIRLATRGRAGRGRLSPGDRGPGAGRRGARGGAAGAARPTWLRAVPRAACPHSSPRRSSAVRVPPRRRLARRAALGLSAVSASCSPSSRYAASVRERRVTTLVHSSPAGCDRPRSLLDLDGPARGLLVHIVRAALPTAGETPDHHERHRDRRDDVRYLPARLGEPSRALVVSPRIGRCGELPVVAGTLVSQTCSTCSPCCCWPSWCSARTTCSGATRGPWSGEPGPGRCSRPWS